MGASWREEGGVGIAEWRCCQRAKARVPIVDERHERWLLVAVLW